MVPGLVSTIIPVYNRASFLCTAVESVLSQTYRSVEIIISDDGSTDDTARIARGLVESYPGAIRFVANPNRGPGPARESGRMLAQGEFIQYLDSDDLLLPRKFEVQVEALRRRRDCGVAYGKSRLVDEAGVILRSPFKWTGERRDTLFPGLLVDRWWCTHTPLYRRSVTDEVGPWSDLRYSQDWEYDARVGALSTRLAYCDEMVSEHRHHSGVRQTGAGAWLEPADQLRFFHGLFEGATRADVAVGSPEMVHFSRWVFRHARVAGALGDAYAAVALCRLAAEAEGGESLELRAYRLLAGLVGWRRAASWTEEVRRLFRIRRGMRSIKQSWMDSI